MCAQFADPSFFFASDFFPFRRILESVSSLSSSYLFFFQVTWFVKIEPITHSLLCHNIYASLFSELLSIVISLFLGFSVQCCWIQRKKIKCDAKLGNKIQKKNTTFVWISSFFSLYTSSCVFVFIWNMELTFEKKRENNVDSFIFSQFDSIEINWFNYECVYCCADAMQYILLVYRAWNATVFTFFSPVVHPYVYLQSDAIQSVIYENIHGNGL